MITPEWCRTMARYNAWQNQSAFLAANGLSDEARQADRGAFFGSVAGTLSHVFWGDLIWIGRFDGGPGPEADLDHSAGAYDWPTLMTERPVLDARIAAWAWMIAPEELDGEVSWFSGAAGRQMTMPTSVCVMQMFNHQTHHRGQVHAMLTAMGARPDATDLPFMPEEVPEWH